VSKLFGATVAVDAVSLDIAPGEFLALLGESGCGKTTLLRLIAGLERPDGGEILLAGRLVASARSFVAPEARQTGLVFQEHALFPHMTVEQNVGYGITQRGERAARVQELLELVGLHGYARQMPHQLSGGEQQRVALARSLATRPAVMLLDEPFSSLDPNRRAQLRMEVRAILNQAGVAALLVTHDHEEALSMADRVAVMEAGRVVQIAPPETIYQAPVSRTIAEFVGEAIWLPGEASGDRVQTALGELRTSRDASGPVTILLRPEMIRLHPPTGDITARVIERRFFGHDQLITVEFPTGQRLLSRTFGSASWRPGDHAAIAIDGPVQIFD
jgi:iron(III) transport system ATP-binding protein